MILIFTDLDGTLLNHDDYAYADAAVALDRIRGEKIPLIFVTSKTRKEVESLHQELGVAEPFVVENGGAIFFPEGYRGFHIKPSVRKEKYAVIELGKSYDEIRRFFSEVRDDYGMRGFGDMDLEEIKALTNLSAEQARWAKEREFTEPFVLKEGDRIADLEESALRQGLKVTRGGRFHHLIGVNQDKGRAVETVLGVFEENIDQDTVSIGLGDSENDIPMLRAVDRPILIPKERGAYEPVALPHMIKARYPGSKGWNEAVLEILERWH